jgi:Cu(I)/Ag(I) efflux system periplasmic protein CusF
MNRRQALLGATLASEFGLFCAPKLAFAQAPMSSGEVVKVDKDAGRITLKHNGIKTLEVPAMSLVFRVANAAWLNDVAAGDRVRFRAERVDGQYTITAINKAP